VAGGNTVVAIESSDTNMIAIDETNPAIPVLDIKSNVAFGVVKLDSAGQIPVNLMPTTGITYQGQFDASPGTLPTGTYVTGDFYNIEDGGTLSLYTSSGGPSPKAVVIGDQIIYDESLSGWWYNAASAVASIAAAAVTFVPHGTIAATNAQSAIEELDSETQTALSGKAPSSASTAVGTSFTPAGNVAATNVQTAIAELDAEKAPTSAGTAAGTSFAPAGNIAATNVQAALQELDSEKLAALGISFTEGSLGGSRGYGFSLNLPASLGGVKLRWGYYTETYSAQNEADIPYLTPLGVAGNPTFTIADSGFTGEFSCVLANNSVNGFRAFIKGSAGVPIRINYFVIGK